MSMDDNMQVCQEYDMLKDKVSELEEELESIRKRDVLVRITFTGDVCDVFERRLEIDSNGVLEISIPIKVVSQ